MHSYPLNLSMRVMKAKSGQLFVVKTFSPDTVNFYLHPDVEVSWQEFKAEDGLKFVEGRNIYNTAGYSVDDALSIAQHQIDRDTAVGA